MLLFVHANGYTCYAKLLKTSARQM